MLFLSICYLLCNIPCCRNKLDIFETCYPSLSSEAVSRAPISRCFAFVILVCAQLPFPPIISVIVLISCQRWIIRTHELATINMTHYTADVVAHMTATVINLCCSSSRLCLLGRGKLKNFHGLTCDWLNVEASS